MIQDNTRREFLHSISGLSVFGIPTQTDNEDSTTAEDPTLIASDLVIPTSEAPRGFESYSTPDSNSFIDALKEADFDVASTDIAVSGHWKGTTPSEPEWVLSSTAIVADDPIPRATIETATQQSYNEYVTAYDAETSPLIEFEQSHTRGDRVSDWRVDIIETPLFDDSNKGAEHIFTDHMRLQFFENVVIGTIAYGPTDTDPQIDLLLDKYATLQRTRYETHGAMS